MRQHSLCAGEPTLRAPARPESKDAASAYFTGEIFEHARPNNRRTLRLVRAAAVRHRSATPAAITGTTAMLLVLALPSSETPATTAAHVGSEPVYQFHALFREFLLGASPPPTHAR